MLEVDHRGARAGANRRRARHAGIAALAAAAGVVLAIPVAAEAKPLRYAGTATVVSVDGPALLTIKVQQRTVKLRLFGIDAPQAGECGSAESVAALKRLVRGKRRTVHYELTQRDSGAFVRDAEGRNFGMLGPKGFQYGLAGSVAEDLLATDWVRSGDALGPADGPTDHGWGTSSYSASMALEARPTRGLWASCGGLTHLPLGQPAPAHAPAPWAVTADGILEAVGPLSFPSTLTPETALTVAQVAALVPVELSDISSGRCLVRVPSLQIMLFAASHSAKYPCGQADVYGVQTTGPGAATTTSGLAVGARSSAATALFPRTARTGTERELLALSGDGHPWAWQTIGMLSDRGIITGFTTVIANDDGEL